MAAPTKGHALEALSDWWRVTGERLPPRVRAVWDALNDLAFEPNGRRVGRGVVEVWYSDVGARAGLGENATGRAIRWLRQHGFLAGAPNEPDPENDWYRERARYVLTIPGRLARVLAHVRYAAQRAADREARAAAAAARADAVAAQLAANVAAGANAARHHDRSQRVGPRAVFTTDVQTQEVGTASPVDIRPLPPDYAAARDRLLARKGKGP
jgi:hypothetical protein